MQARGERDAQVVAAPLRAHRTGGHCGSAALRDLLEHHGLNYGEAPLSESEVFVLAGGLSVLFTDAARGGYGMYLLGRSHTLEVDLCAHLDVDCDPRSTPDPATAWRWVQRELVAGRPTMVWADIQHLDYLNVRMQNSNHDVIVVGYEGEAGDVLLADHALPGVQRCSRTSFAAARASVGFPGPHGHRTWFLRWPDALPPAEEAVARGLHRAAEHLLHGERDAAYATGPPALAAIGDAIGRWRELDDDALRERVRRLWFCIERAGTGGGFFRGIWATGLRRLADALDDPPLRRISGLYAELASEWSTLARDGLRRDRKHALPAMALRFEHIVSLEDEGARGLAAWRHPRLTSTGATEAEG